MGYYATTTALADRLVSLEFDTATTALATACIDDAEAEVNKWLSRRYVLASYQTAGASVPPMMRTLAYRLAEAYVWQRSSRGSKESLARADKLEKGVLANLVDLAEYRASLVNTSGALIPNDVDSASARVLCNTTDYSPTFNEGSSAHWRVDRDKISASDDGDF